MCEGDGSSFIGMWSGTAPICSGIYAIDIILVMALLISADLMCSTLSDPQNGVITFSVANGSLVATYSCDVGYALNSGNTVRTCTAEVWDGIAPICEGIQLLHTLYTYSQTYT